MNYVVFVLSFVLFLGGLVLMGYAPAMEGVELVSFLGGILAVSLSFAIPAHILKTQQR